MRYRSFLVVAVVLVSLNVRAEDKATLKRKPGLWEVSVTADGQPMPMGMKQCADEATDATFMQMSQMQSESCSMSGFTKTAAGYEFSAECQFAVASTVSKVISKGLFTGDFESEYRGEIVTTMDPPMYGRNKSKSTIVAKWLGACPAGMKPGDTQMGDGATINMEQAKQGAKLAAEMMKNPEMQKAMKNAMAGAAEAQEALKGLAAAGTSD